MFELSYLLITLGGTIIQSVSGFGFGIFVMTFFPTLFSVNVSAALSGLLSMVSTIYLCWKFRKHCQYRRLIFPALGFFVFSLPSILLSAVSPNALLQKFLAVVLILFSIYFFFFESRVKLKESPLAGFVAGALGGILGGFFSMGGPPVVAYILQTSRSREQYMGEIQSYFLITNIFSLGVRFANGMIKLLQGENLVRKGIKVTEKPQYCLYYKEF